MNDIDQAIGRVLEEVGPNWAFLSAYPNGIGYQEVGKDAANRVETMEVQLIHRNLGVVVGGFGATFGLALADAVWKIVVIDQEVTPSVG